MSRRSSARRAITASSRSCAGTMIPTRSSRTAPGKGASRSSRAAAADSATTRSSCRRMRHGTAAELDPAAKNEVSHRAQALRAWIAAARDGARSRSDAHDARHPRHAVRAGGALRRRQDIAGQGAARAHAAAADVSFPHHATATPDRGARTGVLLRRRCLSSSAWSTTANSWSTPASSTISTARHARPSRPASRRAATSCWRSTGRARGRCARPCPTASRSSSCRLPARRWRSACGAARPTLRR